MDRRFPRLSPAQAKPLVSRLQGLSVEELRSTSRTLPDLATEPFAATGMQRVTMNELKTIQERLRARMIDAGYPELGGDVRREVDQALAKELAELGLPTGEMLRRDVWAWMTVHLLPDYLVWRWAAPDGSITETRFGGSVLRNALGRLWLRGVVFDLGAGASDRWSLMERIPEDATQAILDRTTVSADHRLARIFAQAWLDSGTTGTAAEKLLRRTMILLRVKAALVETSALDGADLKRMADSAFAEEME